MLIQERDWAGAERELTLALETLHGNVRIRLNLARALEATPAGAVLISSSDDLASGLAASRAIEAARPDVFLAEPVGTDSSRP